MFHLICVYVVVPFHLFILLSFFWIGGILRFVKELFVFLIKYWFKLLLNWHKYQFFPSSKSDKNCEKFHSRFKQTEPNKFALHWCESDLFGKFFPIQFSTRICNAKGANRTSFDWFFSSFSFSCHNFSRCWCTHILCKRLPISIAKIQHKVCIGCEFVSNRQKFYVVHFLFSNANAHKHRLCVRVSECV